MPIFFQHPVNDTTRLGIWKIEETEEFFKGNVPQHRDVTHPHKRLQHLAGRFLLQFLFPDFPYELIRIADTRKPFLPGEQYHFSISHCGDYAAAIVSKDRRVGIDIEIPVEKIGRIADKFINKKEKEIFGLSTIDYRLTTPDSPLTTHHSQLLLSSGLRKNPYSNGMANGGVDFRENILLNKQHEGRETIDCFFTKSQQQLLIHYRLFDHLVLSWVDS